MKYRSVMKEDKKQTIIFVVFVFFYLCSAGYFLPKTGIQWISNNLTSFVYSSLFVVTVFLFGKEIIKFIHTIRVELFQDLIKIGAITIIVQIIVSIFLELVLKIENMNQNSISQAQTQAMGYDMFLLNLTIIIFAPIVEEVVYRYCLFNLFLPNRFLSYFVSVFLFAFMHVWEYVLIDGQLNQLVTMSPYIVLGLGFTILYERTGNLCYPIILHMAINFISVVK